MTTKIDVKPEDWFDTRELRWAPCHFIRCPVTVSKTGAVVRWITENTRGRYAFHQWIVRESAVITRDCLSFENPQEAMMFTLWYQQQPDIF